MIRRPPRSTLSLHDALPISGPPTGQGRARRSPHRTRARESPPLSLESPEQLLVAGLARAVRRLVLLGVLGQDEARPEGGGGAPRALDDGAAPLPAKMPPRSPST